jgi:hypothetical protein
MATTEEFAGEAYKRGRPRILSPLFPRLAYEQVHSSLGRAKHGPLHDRKGWGSGLAYPFDTPRASSHLDEEAHGY